MNCINKNSKEFKELVDLVGYDNTIAYYIAQGFTFVDESVKPDSVKPGVAELFESNPELASIGTPEQYSRYLDTIFPDSKVKDIVYHGSPSNNKQEFKKTDNYKDDFYKREGFFFSQDETETSKNALKKNYGGNLYSVLLNINNPEPNINFSDYQSANVKSNYDSAIISNTSFSPEFGGIKSITKRELYVVFEPEQIHILGNKQDIEGFKEFVQGKQFQKLTAEEKAKTIEQVTKEHRSITALKDLAAKLAHRIGGKVAFVNKTDVDWKGYNQGMTSVLNEAYMTPDTPFHEILAHPIIKAIKNNKVSVFKDVSKSMSEIEIPDNLNEFTTNSFGYRKINNEWYQVFNGIKGEELEKVSNETAKYSYTISKEIKETPQTKKVEFKEFNQLYQSLLKELETGRGKEVFEQVKRDYVYKNNRTNFIINKAKDFHGAELFKVYSDIGEEASYYTEKEALDRIEFLKNLDRPKYTLEEQQEEAIVTLLGMMAVGKLDAKKDATLISKFKELWKQISDFVKQLLLQDSIKIDELPITTTLNDLAEIMAYGNNKIILPGYKIEYSTPLGNKYDTLEEVNQEIRGLADANVEVDLSNISIENILPNSFTIGDYYVSKKGNNFIIQDEEQNIIETININQARELYKKSYEYQNQVIKIESGILSDNNIKSFIEKNKEYEQAKEIIEQWKKENNIQYDPEEVYSRGQGFYSSIGAYSNLELDLLLKNLIQHIEDNKKAGGEFTISAFTKPIGKRLKHIEGTGDRVRFVIYPQSEHIKWAAPTDVYSGSVWDAHEKVSKDKKSELLGVSFTKAPALRNINEVSPNLADIIDNLSHVHNELGIELTTNNFRIEYDDNIDYSTKKLIDNINKILDDKYGKLIKPEINTEKGNQFYKDSYMESEDVNAIIYTKIKHGYNVKWIEYLGDKELEKVYYEKNMTFEEAVGFQPNLLLGQKGKQPTQTRENTTSIESVKYKIANDLGNGNFKAVKDQNFWKIVQILDNGVEVGMSKEEDYYEPFIFDTKEQAENYINKGKEKEYTSQAETNLKVAALKEVARKYPRSLIRSEIKPIDGNKNSSNFNVDDLYFQKLSNNEPKGIKLIGTAKKNAAKALGLTTKFISWDKLQKVKKRVKSYNNANKYNKLFVQTEYSVRNNQSVYSWEIYDSGNKQIDMFDDVELIVQTPEIKIVSPIVEERLLPVQKKESDMYRDLLTKINEELLLGITEKGDSVPLSQPIVGPEYINPNSQREKYEAFVQNYNSEYGKNITGYEFLIEDENENIARISDYKDFMDYLQSYNLKGLDIRDYSQGVYNFETSRKEPPKNDNFDLGLDPISGLPVPPKC